MTDYMVRRVGPHDIEAVYRAQRWAVHPSGYPCDVRAFALTKRGARRIARRWQRSAASAKELPRMTDLPMLNLGAPGGQTYPRPITSVHQIEVTTFCSLRCVYCPSPKLEQHRGQPKTHMDLDTFARALEWAKHFETKGTQGELSITGIGETLLHPEWKKIIAMAREALPTNYLNFSTNGLALDDAACEHLARYGFKVFVSLHRPEKAGPAMNRAQRHGILETFNASAATSSMDWAGQLDWEVTAPASRCEWLAQGWSNILVDGRVSTCCLDASGVGVVGHVDDEIGSLSIKPYELCGPCHQVIP